MTTYLYQQKNAIRVGFFNDRIITFSRPGHVCAWACTVAALLMYDAVSEEKCAAGYRALTDLTTSNKGTSVLRLSKLSYWQELFLLIN